MEPLNFYFIYRSIPHKAKSKHGLAFVRKIEKNTYYRRGEVYSEIRKVQMTYSPKRKGRHFIHGAVESNSIIKKIFLFQTVVKSNNDTVRFPPSVVDYEPLDQLHSDIVDSISHLLKDLQNPIK